MLVVVISNKYLIIFYDNGLKFIKKYGQSTTKPIFLQVKAWCLLRRKHKHKSFMSSESESDASRSTR